jgi:hypothetical protein
MLSLPRNIAFLDEPLNLQTGVIGVEHQFIYIGEDTPDLRKQYDKLLHDLLSGRSTYKKSVLSSKEATVINRVGRHLFNSRTGFDYKLNFLNPLKDRLLLKDPIACFASEYIHRHVGTSVVVIIRHPASTIASYKRLDWHFGLEELTRQKELMHRYLDPILSGLDVQALSHIEAWAYFWLCIYTVLDDYISHNPAFIVVRHEDVSTTPLPSFEKLYEQLGMAFTPSIQQQIIRYTSKDNPVHPPNNAVHALKRNSAENIHRWKELLTASEVDRIRDITGPLAGKYYTEADW